MAELTPEQKINKYNTEMQLYKSALEEYNKALEEYNKKKTNGKKNALDKAKAELDKYQEPSIPEGFESDGNGSIRAKSAPNAKPTNTDAPKETPKETPKEEKPKQQAETPKEEKEMTRAQKLATAREAIKAAAKEGLNYNKPAKKEVTMPPKGSSTAAAKEGLNYDKVSGKTGEDRAKALEPNTSGAIVIGEKAAETGKKYVTEDQYDKAINALSEEEKKEYESTHEADEKKPVQKEGNAINEYLKIRYNETEGALSDLEKSNKDEKSSMADVNKVKAEFAAEGVTPSQKAINEYSKKALVNDYNKNIWEAQDKKIYNLDDKQKARLERRRQNKSNIQRLADELGVNYSTVLMDTIGTMFNNIANAMSPLTGQKPFAYKQTPLMQEYTGRLTGKAKGEESSYEDRYEMLTNIYGIENGEITVNGVKTGVTLKQLVEKGIIKSAEGISNDEVISKLVAWTLGGGALMDLIPANAKEAVKERFKGNPSWDFANGIFDALTGKGGNK